ncbi:hypothetical protein GCM10029992_28260 [Glycomyces albus]
MEELPDEAREDPMHHRSGGVDPGRDGCRVPLPWTAGDEAFGFGGPPWLPQPADWGRYAVETQLADPDSTLSLYRRAIGLRRALRGADFAWIPTDPQVLAFRRGEDLTCVVNFGDAPAALPDHTEVLIASTPLEDGRLPGDAAAWLRTRPSHNTQARSTNR